MNVNFKVLWFEDEMGWRPSSERSMKKIIESHNLVPIITWKKGDEGDAEEELKKEYDLILMDYELRGTMGNILIKKLRQFDIYTDVVFYSGNYNKMVKALYNIDEKGMNIEPVDGIYFSDRKREELFPKLQKVVDKVVRRMQDIVNLRGVVLDNVSGFENQMQNILVLAANKFSQAQIKSLNEYTKNKLIVPAKNEYIRKIDEIESNPEALKAIISAPDYFLDSYKKARLVGRVIKIMVCITKISTFLILCDLAVCLATLYVSFSLVFALMRYLQGKVFLIRFYSPTTLSSSRAEFRLPSRLACA